MSHYELASSSSPENTNNMTQQQQLVSAHVINEVLDKLRLHRDAPSRLSTKRTQPSCSESESQNDDLVTTAASSSSNKIPKIDLKLQKNLPQPSLSSTDKLKKNVQPLESVSSSSLSSSTSSSSFNTTMTTTTSSSEDELSNYQKYLKQNNSGLLSEMQQPISIEDYLKQSYSNYPKYPKLHSNNNVNTAVAALPYTTTPNYTIQSQTDWNGYNVSQSSAYNISSSSGVTLSNCGGYGGGGVSGTNIDVRYVNYEAQESQQQAMLMHQANHTSPLGYVQTSNMVQQSQYFYNNPSEQISNYQYNTTIPQYNYSA